MEMRVAVCAGTDQETQCLFAWIKAYCAVRGQRVKLCPMASLEELWGCFSTGAFDGVFLGAGDTDGFLAARRLREEDRKCQVVLIDDTQRFVLPSYRLHVTDFLLRPLTQERVGQSVERLLEWRR